MFQKIILDILKDHSQLLTISAKSMENTSKEVKLFSKVAQFQLRRKMIQRQIQNSEIALLTKIVNGFQPLKSSMMNI